MDRLTSEPSNHSNQNTTIPSTSVAKRKYIKINTRRKPLASSQKTRIITPRHARHVSNSSKVVKVEVNKAATPKIAFTVSLSTCIDPWSSVSRNRSWFKQKYSIYVPLTAAVSTIFQVQGKWLVICTESLVLYLPLLEMKRKTPKKGRTPRKAKKVAERNQDVTEQFENTQSQIIQPENSQPDIQPEISQPIIQPEISQPNIQPEINQPNTSLWYTQE